MHPDLRATGLLDGRQPACMIGVAVGQQYVGDGRGRVAKRPQFVQNRWRALFVASIDQGEVGAIGEQKHIDRAKREHGKTGE